MPERTNDAIARLTAWIRDYGDQKEPVFIEDLQAVLAEVERLRTRLLTAAGDDLCRLSQEEIKAMSAGTVKIPPKEEFLASCERFHAQVANEVGVMDNCMTLAQLVAENERLKIRGAQVFELLTEAQEKWQAALERVHTAQARIAELEFKPHLNITDGGRLKAELTRCPNCGYQFDTSDPPAMVSVGSK